MKKGFFIICFSVFVFTLLFGCSGKVPEMNSTERSSEKAETTTETTTLTTVPPLKHTKGKYIYDNAKIFGKSDYNDINDYIGGLCEESEINIAVVTENDINGEKPENFARKRYKELFDGNGDGMLLLINNDTKVDYLYKSGICEENISEEDEKNAFYTATREIVEGDYKSAVICIIKLAENCISG
ncbi:MAG: TPM domain-containing protein [Ruminococcus sp.]|nr:TPM domain-containing protein [Ruminococcus sp.]